MMDILQHTGRAGLVNPTLSLMGLYLSSPLKEQSERNLQLKLTAMTMVIPVKRVKMQEWC